MSSFNDPYMNPCVAGPTAIEKLFAECRRDPIVGLHFQTWQHGGFQSFESMLCHLAVALCESRLDLIEWYIKATGCGVPGGR